MIGTVGTIPSMWSTPNERAWDNVSSRQCRSTYASSSLRSCDAIASSIVLIVSRNDLIDSL